MTRPWEDTPSTARAAADEVGKVFYAKAQEADRMVVGRVGEIAEARGISRAQIALAWLLHKKGVTAPVVGATKMSQLDDALAAMDVTLSTSEVHSLEELYTPHLLSGYE